MAKKIVLLGLALVFGLFLALPAYGQVEVEDLGYQAKAVEPGKIDMRSSSPATLGAGIIIMKFKVTDLDPQADDPSDVTIDKIVVENLGSATGPMNNGGDPVDNCDDAVDGDICEVMILDQDGNSITNPSCLGPDPDKCFEDSPNPNIAFQYNAYPQSPPFKIPDDGMETFQVAVRTTGTDVLRDDSQGHTLRLRVTIRFSEKIGSPPTTTTFTAVVTDGATEFVWNGGINDPTDDTVVVNPLMPGETGTVSRFTLCDNDSNEYNLIIYKMSVKQAAEGTALYTDIDTLSVYRLEGNTRTLVATKSVDSANFNRGGLGSGIPIGDSPDKLYIFIGDDTCATFEIDAQVSPYAFKGKTIQLKTQISTKEPLDSSNKPQKINSDVDPQVITQTPTVIGKGLIQLPTVNILGSPGEIPIKVMGMPLPGLGGFTATLKYDPNVIQVDDIVPASGVPYLVEYDETTLARDNRRGEVTFTVYFDELNFDPDVYAMTEGTVVLVKITGAGDAGERTRLTLDLDEITLADAPFTDIQNDVGVAPGEVRLVPKGDVDGDLKVTVTDSLILANQILNDCPGLTDAEQIVADVADPVTTSIPDGGFTGCSTTLDSADVAAIAKLAISSSSVKSTTAEEGQAVTSLQVHGVQAISHAGALLFTVRGQGIAGLQVDMYNLAGKHVVSQQATGSQLRLRAQDERGRPLANGVYLYVVTVKGLDGQLQRTEVKKLVILR